MHSAGNKNITIIISIRTVTAQACNMMEYSIIEERRIAITYEESTSVYIITEWIRTVLSTHIKSNIERGEIRSENKRSEQSGVEKKGTY